MKYSSKTQKKNTLSGWMNEKSLERTSERLFWSRGIKLINCSMKKEKTH